MASALAAHLGKELPPDTEPGLSATYFFEPKNFTFPFGTHIVAVEIDRETGDVKFLRTTEDLRYYHAINDDVVYVSLSGFTSRMPSFPVSPMRRV